MPDAVDKALSALTPRSLEASVEELLAGAQGQLDAAATEVRRHQGDPEVRLLAIAGLLIAAIVATHRQTGRSVDPEEAAGEIRDAVALAENEVSHEVPGRLLYLHVHLELLDLHRRSGRFTRLEDDHSAAALIEGAAGLGGDIIHAVQSGRLEFLVQSL
ncbi:MAG: hypothetical protein JSS68_09180 [Actinobacteria bacterium]|nr:hypothetical protein [Actinomycetota bacterium]MBS1885030.1 hypothetical protein [Actinomycetota bacterium]